MFPNKFSRPIAEHPFQTGAGLDHDAIFVDGDAVERGVSEEPVPLLALPQSFLYPFTLGNVASCRIQHRRLQFRSRSNPGQPSIGPIMAPISIFEVDCWLPA